MRIIKFDNRFSTFSYKEKLDYLKKISINKKIDNVINTLIIYNKDVIENFNLLEEFKRIDYTSLAINSYLQQNKTKELSKYFDSLDKNKIKKILNYEKNNNTIFSKLKLCKDLEKEISSKQKLNILENKLENLDNRNLKKERGTKLFLIVLLFLVLSYMFVGYCYSSIRYYNDHVYPNIYLDNKLIENMSRVELHNYLEGKKNKLQETVQFKNENDSYSYTYQELGFSINTLDVENKINATKNLNGYQKLYKILTRVEERYEIRYDLNEEIFNKFINNLKSKVNVLKQYESFRIINGKINYQRGVNGFTLDDANLKNEIIASLENNSHEINLTGSVEKVNNTLGLINKKVSTFTTYYNESQGRARNIRNAVSKLNGKILYSNDTFSFYRTVGPYNGSRGYIFYAKDVGSGVCQVSTTIYNNALKLNLPIVSRENHGDMVYYVDYGMDATVYGSSVDMKFKNNSNYPIYIEASAYNGALTVNFWSNENIVPSGITYQPRVEKVSALGFKTYLDTYKNGVLINSKYLNSSYYIKGK